MGEEVENNLIEMENFLETKGKIDVHDDVFNKLMYLYKFAMQELETKLKIVQEEFKYFYDYELIDHINYRIKKPESIEAKMKKKNLRLQYRDMINEINDIAGIRVVCPLKKDIFSIKEFIKNIPGIHILKEKDYVNNPKKSGYSSYHIIAEVPVSLSSKFMYVKVEIQIRTMAMDFWASLEHKLKYKSKEKVTNATSKELVSCAKIVQKLDKKMMLLNN